LILSALIERELQVFECNGSIIECVKSERYGDRFITEFKAGPCIFVDGEFSIAGGDVTVF
jgi:hypothetical protein